MERSPKPGGTATDTATTRRRTSSACRTVGRWSVMGSARISYRPVLDATPEGEARALAQAYRFVLQLSEQEKKGACAGAPDDAKESARDRATNSIRRQQAG